jgi:hypothetical protein
MHNVHCQLTCSHGRCHTLSENHIKYGGFVFEHRRSAPERHVLGTEHFTEGIWMKLYRHGWKHASSKMFFGYLFAEHEKGVKFYMTVGS